MKRKLFFAPVALASALSLGACADNYAAEGALAGGALGAGIGAVTDADVATGAALGAAAGGGAGYLVDKDGDCYRTDAAGNRYEVDCP